MDVQHLQKRGWVFIENLIENKSGLNELIAFESLSSYVNAVDHTRFPPFPEYIIQHIRQFLGGRFGFRVSLSKSYMYQKCDVSKVVIGIDFACRVFLTSISNQSATLLQKPCEYIILSIL